MGGVGPPEATLNLARVLSRFKIFEFQFPVFFSFPNMGFSDMSDIWIYWISDDGRGPGGPLLTGGGGGWPNYPQ